ncbi:MULTISPECIES: hypothetical protein [Rufibacter]|uniref:Outer membrane protein beta-barrel domain-containing protein n=1 Tax=Rufibacter quisquiliarum TaxID=1549639 RepID=A0A839GB87_9BACT|nr:MULTISPECIES: hypothetical protein [Rufibacter]MBA9075570.1 hypothetical protein [Rufibacter quisquiliarum]
MLKRFSLLSSLALVFFASGCSSLYMPNVPNTPMLTAKGELSTGAHITFRGNANFNSAYAVSDHIGVLLNGSMMNNSRKKEDFRHMLLEGGGGYFTTFGPENNRVLEIYAGLGYGSSDRTHKKESPEGVVSYDRQETNFKKLFLQVNYSSKKKRYLRLFGEKYPLNYGTALRVSHVNMLGFVRDNVSQPAEDNIFLEPIFFTRMVLSPHVQLQYTSGSNFGLKNRDFMTAGNSVLSVGVVINVGGLNLRK